MACGKYISTKETTHAARLSRLLVDPCTDLFRDLRVHVTEVQFPFVLQNCKAILLPIINKVQRNLLYPKSKQFLGTYEDLDLSLLYILLRNISGIPPHKNGWGKQPDPIDRSLSANIDRIRETRNTYCGHASRVSLNETDFNNIWHDLVLIISELEGSLWAGCTKYTDAAKMIKTDTMDPEREERYLDTIDNQYECIKDLKESATRIIKEQEKIFEKQHQLQEKQDRLAHGLQQQTHELSPHLHKKEEELKSELQRHEVELKYQQQKQKKEMKSVLQRQETRFRCKQQRCDTKLKYALQTQKSELTNEQEKLDIELKCALQKQETFLMSEMQKQGLEQRTEQQSHKAGLEVVKERLSVIEKHSECERNNILDNTVAILQAKRSNSVYVRISVVERIIEKLKEHRFLILTGKAGSGKTTTAYHVMCELSSESYTPVLLSSPEEWNKVINPFQQYFVFLDDFIGSKNFDE
ncbi:E3 ubiquitin-protein ligase DZIP3-like, partial [Saccostrea cucullata]|uniref:E3 ubiquitin-protein ligase DZIP3-like n=1 Tax=Saccostrea cuccullata TaxID=36930 RepID=UPI002ED4EC31